MVITFLKGKIDIRINMLLLFHFFCFQYIMLLNSSKILFNLLKKKNSNKYSSASRITTLLFNMFNIFNILFLTTITIIKLRVHTVVYY